VSGNGADEPVWRLNYFNYFTEVEEHFQRARGTGLFLLSTLDWALLEGWKNSGVPLEAVLRGIDAAFEKWHAKKQKRQAVNSLTYCAQAVMEQARQMANAAPGSSPPPEEANPFTPAAVRAHLDKASAALSGREGYAEVAAALSRLAAELDEHLKRPQELDQRLTALEEKMAAVARTRLSDEQLFEARREMDAQLRPYRGKMSAEQLAMLERKYLDRRVFESAQLPRLSLFYLEMK
jgi:hypothetical protein